MNGKRMHNKHEGNQVGLITQQEIGSDELLDVYAMTLHAQKDWENAWAFFNIAVGPELVDQAIYGLNAAESRYSYFLKLSKQQNIRNGGVPK